MSSARLKYEELAREINLKCLDKKTFTQEINAARENVTDSFEAKCRSLLGDIPLEDFLTSLNDYMKSVTQIRKESGTGGILEVIGSDLRLSEELETLENLDDERVQDIFEVRFISSSKITLDENVFGEFWEGKNLVMYTPEIFVRGRERTIDVSGRNGVSASSARPLTQMQPGTTGVNRADGQAGQCGRHIFIQATHIHSCTKLKLISNSGDGGSGQPGGHGSDGAVDGTYGDDRYSMSLAKLKEMFPSPAKWCCPLASQRLQKGRKSLKNLISANGRYKELTAGGTWKSACWELETPEGAVFRYAFLDRTFSCDFSVWFKGAPGTNGQPGGLGGLGGRSGRPGAPGTITVLTSRELTMNTRRVGGQSVRNAPEGQAGSSGRDGKQGRDFANVDPYAGTYFFSNFAPIRDFVGNLEMLKVKAGFSKHFVSLNSDYSTCCPEEEIHSSFRQTAVARAVLEVCQKPEKPQEQEILIIPRANYPISQQSIKSSYDQISLGTGQRVSHPNSSELVVAN